MLRTKLTNSRTAMTYKINLFFIFLSYVVEGFFFDFLDHFGKPVVGELENLFQSLGNLIGKDLGKNAILGNSSCCQMVHWLDCVNYIP